MVDNSKRRGFLKNQKDQNKGRHNPESAAHELPPVKDSNNKKKIDFKQKAIKQKESAIKKVISKSMKAGGGGGGGG